LLAVTAVLATTFGAWMLTPVGEPGARGRAAIGGPFELVNGAGETVTAADFRGRYMLVYFGFTYCPDVCPTALLTLTRALERLERAAPEKAARIKPVFISVDPARDTPAALRAYVDHFHPRLTGLTGSPEQVAAAAEAYRVYYEKVPADGSAADYLIDHSAYTYLMGPEGRYLTHFEHGTEPRDMAAALERRVAAR
jgi:protein SCO1/2